MTSPKEMPEFNPLPTDMVLFIRDGQPVIRSPTNDGGIIPEDCLILIAIAASWNDDTFRDMMLGAVHNLADAGELESLMTVHRSEKPN